MKLSWEWLSELVDTNELTPVAVANALTNAGLEVEEVETTGPEFTNVIVAKVLKLDPHPNADKLRLVTVDIGGNNTTQVVCGAPNVAEGQLIAFAQKGAKVYSRKTSEWFELGEAVIRGVPSCGMVCAISELKLDEQFSQEGDGIWELNKLAAPKITETHIGQPLEQALALKAQIILHTAPTANRGDLMSVMGVAREVAAIFNRKLQLPTPPPLPSKTTNPNISIEPFKEAACCNYYTLTTFNTVTVAPSPEWLKQRLETSGVRSINNVVDITNYVMLLTGQPMHAFDIKRLDPQGNGGSIGVRFATDGEKLTTLDGIELALNPQANLITFNDTPVALAGVMGGEHTGIYDDTTQVALEVAHFDSAITRRSARVSGGLRSESSARFERGTDAYGIDNAITLTIQLMQELAQATVADYAVSAMDQRQQIAPIAFDHNKIESVLGQPLSQQQVVHILTPLGFSVKVESPTQSTITVPSWRQNDVKQPIDIIEELIRIYGFDDIPFTLPVVEVTPEITLRAQTLKLIQQQLLGLGLSQAMTMSLVNPEEKDNLITNPLPTQHAVHVVNSHSKDHTVLRQSLLPGLITVAKHHTSQDLPYCWQFELGRHYYQNSKQPGGPKQTTVSEPLHLGMVLYGHPISITLGKPNDPANFFTLKGMLENLFNALGLEDSLSVSALTDDKLLHPGQAASILLDGKAIGKLGQLHPLKAQALKLRQKVFLLELNLEPVIKKTQQNGLFKQFMQPLSVFPWVQRDIALLTPTDVTHQSILNQMRKEKSPLLQNIQLFDTYQGPNLPEGKRSLAYRLTIGSYDKTLTDQDIETIVSNIKTSLKQLPSVELRE